MRMGGLERGVRAVVVAAVAAGALVATEAVSAAPSAAEGARYVVHFRAGATETGKRALHERGAKVVLDLARHQAVAAHIPDDAVDDVRGDPHVEFVEIDPRRYRCRRRCRLG